MVRKKILALRITVEGLSEEAKQIAKLDTKLTLLNQKRKELIKTIKESGSVTKKQKKQLSQLSAQVTQLKTSKTKLNAVERLNNRLNEANTGSIVRLRAASALLRREVNEMEVVNNKQKRQRQKKIQQLSIINQKIRDYDRAMSGNNTLIGEYTRGAVDSFKKMAFAIIGVVAVVRSLSFAIKSLTNDYATFETGQLSVQGLMDKWNTTLKDESIQLLKTYGIEIGDLNKALFDNVSALGEAADTQKVMNEAAILAIGGTTSLASGISGLTTVINTYKTGTDEANEIASAFFTAQRFGVVTVEELTNEIGVGAAAAKAAGEGYRELLTAYAVLTKNGLKATDATTAYKNIISAVIKPSEQAAKAFKGLGIETGQIAVKKQGVFNILVKVAEAIKQENVEINELFPNIRALIGASTLNAEALEFYDEVLRRVNEDYGEGSSLMRAYNMQMESVQKNLDQIKAKTKAKRIELGEKLAPVIRRINRNYDSYFKKLKQIVIVIASFIVGSRLATLAMNAKNIALSIYNTMVIKATAATQALTAAQKANLWGMLASLIAMAVLQIDKYVKGQIKAKVSIEDFNNVVRDETTEITNLFEQLKETNAETEERLELIRELQRLVPDIIDNYELETAELVEIKKAQEAVNDEIIKTIALREQEAKINEVSRKATAKIASELEKIIKFADTPEEEAGVIKLMARLTKEMKSGEITYKEATNAMADYLDIVGDVSKWGKIRQVVINIDQSTTLLDKSTDHITRFYKALIATGKQINEFDEIIELDIASIIDDENKELLKSIAQTNKILAGIDPEKLEEASKKLRDKRRKEFEKNTKTQADLEFQFREARINNILTGNERELALLKLKHDKEMQSINERFIVENELNDQELAINDVLNNLKIEKQTEYQDKLKEVTEEFRLNKELEEAEIRELEAITDEEYFQAQLETAQLRRDQELAIAQGNKLKELQAEEKFANAVDGIENDKLKNTLKRIDEEKKAQLLKVAFQRDILNSLVQLFGQETALGKIALAFERALAIKEIIINTKKAVLKQVAKRPPLGLPWAPFIIGAGAAAAIAIGKQTIKGFEGGGVVEKGFELANAPSNGDNTLVLAKPGEVILNKDQQNRAGGIDFFRSIGVPMRAAGGWIEQPLASENNTFNELAVNLAELINDKSVVLNLNELNEEQGKLDNIKKSSSL